jgi:hypothetical protein
MRSHGQTQGGHNQKPAESDTQKHQSLPSAPPAFSAYGKMDFIGEPFRRL